jgi:acyl transferase domain-containing protein/thiamine pyrophosphate-dependent acetolactate synthase large subunit-like protein/acyl-CoA synthetase (AMP-forming)/AMP-acid ligase II/NAD(P)-dependent dehydrogenase (short-subunit alcohol dehydrogenase family)/acetyltransferase-like isoleucine patch superfamily enzyme
VKQNMSLMSEAKKGPTGKEMLTAMADLWPGNNYTGSVLVALSLKEAGIRSAYGIPGVQNLKLYEGLADCRVTNTLIANEESAAYMAAAAWKAGTPMSCVNIIGGPGITHALPGIALAKEEHVPVLILTTGIKRQAQKAFQLHDVDNLALLAPACKAVLGPQRGEEIPSLILRAAILAQTSPYGPVGIELPSDMLEATHPFCSPSFADLQALEKCTKLCVRPRRAVALAPNGGVKGSSGAAAAWAAAIGALAEDHVIVSDSDSAVGSLLGEAAIQPSSAFHSSSISFSVPAAIGCAAAGKSTIALVNPRSMLMAGLELITAAAAQLPLVLIVPSEGVDGQGEVQNLGEAFGIPSIVIGKENALQEPDKILSDALKRSSEMPGPIMIVVEGLRGAELLLQKDEGVKEDQQETVRLHGGANLLARALRASGVSQIFAHHAVAGEGEELLRSLDAQEGISVCVCTDDQSVGFAADGWARSSGGDSIAAVLLDAGSPTMAHFPHAGLSGVGEALLDSVPVLVLVLADSDSEVAQGLLRSAEEVCKGRYVPCIGGEYDVDLAIAAAVVSARSGCPGPAAVALPRSALVDPQLAVPSLQWAREQARLCSAAAADCGLQGQELKSSAQELVEALLSAKSPRLHVGLGATHAAEEVRQLAEAVNATVSSTFSGKGVLSEAHPLWIWPALGAAIPPPLRPIADEADVLVVLGARLGELSTAHYAMKLPAERTWHVDLDDVVVGANYEVKCGVKCDSRDFLRAVLAELRDRCRPDQSGVKIKLRAAHEEVERLGQVAISKSSTLCDPHCIFAELQRALPSETVFLTDSGNGTVMAAEHLRLRQPRRILSPTNYSSMGFCVPAAVGAALAGAPCAVAAVGDGAFLMTGLELATAKRMGLPVVLALLNDGELGMMSGLQRAAGRQPFCTILPPYNMRSIAAFLRIPYRQVNGPGEMAQAAVWAARAGTSGPVILDIRTTYETLSFYSSGCISSAMGRDCGGMSREFIHRPTLKMRNAPRSPSTMKSLKPDPYVSRARPGARNASFARAELQKRSESDSWDAWDLMRHALLRHPSKPAVIDGEHRLTYAQIGSRSVLLGRFLHNECGVRRGDIVASLLPNCLEALEIHFQAAWCRAVHLNLNRRLMAAELAGIIDDAGPVVIVASIAYRDLLEEALSLRCCSSAIRTVIWCHGLCPPSSLSGGCDQEIAYDNVVEQSVLSVEDCLDPCGEKHSAEDGYEMYYTSGTTGKPKGIVLSHRNVIMHCLGTMIEHRLYEGDVWGHIAPMFHLVDAYAIFAMTWLGGKHVMLRAFSPKTCIELIEEHKVTATNVASTMITLLLAHPGVETRDFSSLEVASCGGAPLNRETAQKAQEILGCEFFLSYGMSECCGKISMSLLGPEMKGLPLERQLDYITTSGRPFMLMDIRVVNADGSDVPWDGSSAGEVWIKGPTVFRGYWKNEKATLDAFSTDGWFMTGDVAFVDPRGYITICDRKKDMILVGSENVFAMEVEKAIQDHPSVKHASVFGTADDMMGEAVTAVVVLVDGCILTARDVRRWTSTQLADYKVPRHVHFLMSDEIPMTGSGKIAKAELKKRFRGGNSAQLAKAAVEKVSDASSVAREATKPLTSDTYKIAWERSRSASRPSKEVLLGATSAGSTVIVAAPSDREGSLALELALTELAGATLIRTDASSEEWAAALGPSVNNVIFLWPAGMRAVPEDSEQDETEDCIKALLLTCQAIAAANILKLDRLLIATRGLAVPEAGASLPDPFVLPNPLAHAVWGFGRSLSAERPNWKIMLLDLCPCEVELPADCRAITYNLLSQYDGSRSEIALRARVAYEPRLERMENLVAPPRDDTREDMEEHKVSIITGGLGGLGLNLASEMSKSWPRGKVVLVSRRPPSSEVLEKIDIMRQEGAIIETVQGDVCDLADVVQVFGIAQKLGRITAIYHLAGVVDDGTIEKIDWGRFRRCLDAKLRGSNNLYVAASRLELKLEKFVLFSSIYGLLGYRELTHYGAANAYQDGLAHLMKSKGVNALAMSWGTWGEAGMAHGFGSGFESYWTSLGMKFVPLLSGMETLRAVISMDNVTHAAVLPADWNRYKAKRGNIAVHPLTLGLVGPTAITAVEQPKVKLPPLLEMVFSSSSPIEALKAQLCAQVESMLVGGEGVAETCPLVELGISSMLALELMDWIIASTGLSELPPTLVYEAVNVRGLAEVILREAESLYSPSAVAKRGQQPHVMEVPNKSNSAVDPNAPELVKALFNLRSPPQQLQLLVDTIQRLVESLIDVPGLGRDAVLSESGLSSVHAIEFTDALGTACGLNDLPATIVYECVTIQGVAEKLLQALQPALQTTFQPVLESFSPQGSSGPSGSSGSTEPMAIVGMSCRLPGGASTLERYWSNLMEGRNCVIEPPVDRDHMGRSGGYLSADEVALFDHEYFGISPLEAQSMDPQQRLLLECAQEAMEDAGCQPGKISAENRDIGVFVALETNDYAILHQEAVACSGEEATGPYRGTGWHGAIASNRISYVMNLNGPSITLNTACSSSLVALDAAVGAIRRGQASAALVGGANIQLRPEWSNAFSAAHMLSVDSACKFGDDQANGYVRGEGVGVILIKPLSAALADGDRIYATVVGSTVTQDGRSNGIMAPNPVAQERMLRSVYENAGIHPSQVDYIEAHGTGTRLGDPIEVMALGNTGIGGGNLRIGSVKSSIGHLECAAGIASVIKAALCVHKNMLPPSLHFETPNKLIPWDKVGIRVVTSPEKLTPHATDDVIIGVGGNGFGGTLAHIVMSRSMTPAPVAPGLGNTRSGAPGFHMLPISATTEAAVRATAARWADFLASDECCNVSGAEAATAAACLFRESMPFSGCVAGREVADIKSALAALAESKEDVFSSQKSPIAAFVTKKRRNISRKPRIAFAFTGQGSQYLGMGRGLAMSHRGFRSHLRDAEKALSPHMAGEYAPIATILFSAKEDAQEVMKDPSFLQPALFAVAYALAHTIMDETGVQPTACVGHSLGEIAAMCIAGILSLDDAAALAAGRGRAMGSLPRNGSMAAVMANLQEVKQALFPEIDSNVIAIAAVNSDSATVLSGSEEAIANAAHRLEGKGFRTRILEVNIGFHSSLVEPCLDELNRVAAHLMPAEPSSCAITVVSTLTGRRLESSPNAQYWVDQARGSVNFRDAAVLLGETVDVIVEVGTSPHLLRYIESAAPSATVITTLGGARLGPDAEVQCLMRSLCALKAIFGGSADASGTPLSCIRLPPIAHIGTRHWFSQSASSTGGRRPKPVPVKMAKQAPMITPVLEEGSLFTEEWETLAVPRGTPMSADRSVLIVAGSKVDGLTLRATSSLRRVVSSLTVVGPEDLATVKNQNFDTVLVIVSNHEAPQAPRKAGKGSKHFKGANKTQAAAQPEQVIFPDAPAQLSMLLDVLRMVLDIPSLYKNLVLLTSDALKSTGNQDFSAARAAGAAALGLMRSAARECILLPGMPHMVSIIVDSTLTSGQEMLVQEILHLGRWTPPEVCIAGDERLLRRLRRVPSLTTEEPPSFQGRGRFVITGGTGALGIASASLLVKKGVQVVQLISRSGQVKDNLKEAYEELVEFAKTRGAQVTAEVCDVTDQEALARTLSTGPPLTGVIHAAGLLDDGGIHSLTFARLNRVYSAKAASALALHNLLKPELYPDLEHFILFSSVTSLFGNRGQSSYGAANSVLDWIARSRRVHGSPCTSIQWGPWAGSGMGASTMETSGQIWANLPLSMKSGLHYLELSLSGKWDGLPVVAATDLDWKMVVAECELSNATLSLFRRLVIPILGEKMPSKAVQEDAAFVNLKRLVEDALPGSGAIDAVKVTTLASLGLDSNNGILLLSAINKKFGSDLALVDLLQSPNMGELLSLILKEANMPADFGAAPAIRDDAAFNVLKSLVEAALPGLGAKEAVKATTLGSLGLDSNNGIALQSAINKEFASNLALVDLLQSPNMGVLLSLILKESMMPTDLGDAPTEEDFRPEDYADTWSPGVPAPKEQNTVYMAASAKAPLSMLEAMRSALKSLGKSIANSVTGESSPAMLGLDSIESMAFIKLVNEGIQQSLSFNDIFRASSISELDKKFCYDRHSGPANAPACTLTALEAVQSALRSLGKPSADSVTNETVPASMGLDSIESMAFIKLFCESINCSLSFNEVFRASSIQELSKYIISPIEMPISEFSELATTEVGNYSPAPYRSEASSPTLSSPKGETKGGGSCSGKEKQELETLRRAMVGSTGPTTLVGFALDLVIRILAFGIFAIGFIPIFVYELETGALSGLRSRLYAADGFAEIKIVLELWCLVVTVILSLCFCSIFSLTALKWLLMGRQKPGTYHEWSSRQGFTRKIYKQLNARLTTIGFGQLKTMLPDWVRLKWYRLLGAKIGRNVFIHGASQEWDWDLIEIGSNCTLEGGTWLFTTTTEDGRNYTSDRIVLGDSVFMGRRSRVDRGSAIGRDTILSCQAFAQGFVPAGSIIDANRVLPPGSKKPAHAVDTTVRYQGTEEPVYMFMHTLASLTVICNYAFSYTLGVYVMRACLYLLVPASAWARLPMWTGLLFIPIIILCRDVYCMLSAILCKWLLLGRPAPGQVRKLTREYVIRRWIVDRYLKLAQATMGSRVANTAIHSLLWRSLGMSHNTTTVPSIVNDENDTCDMDCVKIGKHVYFGNRVGFAPVEVNMEVNTATFHSIDLSDRMFMGPHSMVYYGSVFNSMSACGPESIIAPHSKTLPGLLHLGSDTVLGYVQELQYASRFGWMARSLLIVLWKYSGQALILPTIVWIMLQPFSGFDALLPPSYAIGPLVKWITLAVLYVLSILLVYDAIFLLYVIAAKWLCLGRVKEGVQYPLRGSYHCRWILLNHLCQAANVILMGYSNTNVVGTTVYRMMGAKIGKGARFAWSGWTIMPEADLIKYGDYSYNGGIMYSHSFHKMCLSFSPVSVGAGVQVSLGWAQIVPGTHLPDNCTVSHHSNVLIPSTEYQPGSHMHGNLARAVERGPHGEWLMPFDDVVPLSSADKDYNLLVSIAKEPGLISGDNKA